MKFSGSRFCKPRFSLRVVLVACAVVCALLGSNAIQLRRYEAEVSAANVLQGEYLAYIAGNVEHPQFGLTAFPIWDFSELLRGRLYHPITEIQLAEVVLDEDAFAALNNLPYLEALVIQNCQLKQGVQQLHALRSLELLSITGTPISVDVLEWLGNLPPLHSLTLSEVNLSDGDLRMLLASHNRLTTLIVSDNPITNEAIEDLHSLHSLEEVSIANTNCTGGALRYLPTKRLAALDLSGLVLKDDDLVHLRRFQSLQTVRLDGVEILPMFIEELLRLPKLETIWVRDALLGEGAVESLRNSDLKVIGTPASED